MLKNLGIRYEKLGVNSLEISYLADSPYRIAVFDGPGSHLDRIFLVEHQKYSSSNFEALNQIRLLRYKQILRPFLLKRLCAAYQAGNTME